MARRGGTRNPSNNNNNNNDNNRRKPHKKSSKKKSQSRLQDAFQIAEKQQNGNQSSSDDESDSDMKTHGGILNVRKKIEGSSLSSSSKRDSDNDDFDDEEIDSDDVLTSDDEYDVLNSKFSQTLRDRRNNGKGDYSEEEEEGYDSVDEADLIPLSEVWDRDDNDIQKTKKMGLNASNNDIILNEEDDDESDSESESDSEDEDSDVEADEENPFDDLEEDDEDDINGDLEGFVNRLAPKQLKKSKKKSLVNDKAEENLFGLSTSGNKLSIADMMKDIDDGTNEEAILLSKPSKEGEEQIDDSEDESNKAFNVPLPQRIQQRNERKAAYEIQKDEVEKWKDTIQANRQAEVLKFTETKTTHNKPSSFKPIDKPLNELDSKLDALLEQSNIESKKTEDLFEDIETAKISKAEMLKRTNELRLMRELMYRGQKDSKRLKKIKSKTYRQKLRKERQKNKELIEGSDAEIDEEDADYQRAKERMSLKHKNTSKWAKSMIKSGMANDKQNRDEMEEMLKEGEKLRLKQLGKNENESSDDDRDISEVENNNQSDDEVDDSLQRQKLGKGLLNMDFMKNAEKRERLQNLKDAEELKKYKESGNSLDKAEFEKEEEEVANINLNRGRRVYTPSAAIAAEIANKVNREVSDNVEDDEAKSLSNRLKQKLNKKDNKKIQERKPLQNQQPIPTEEEANPWLQDDEEEQHSHRSSKVKVIDESSSKLDKSAAKIAKKANNKKRSSSKAQLDDDVVIDTTETLAIIDPLRQQSEDYEGDATSVKDVKMFKQKDLIKQAFAGDDVVMEEFEQEKKQVEDDEGEQEIDVTLQGWGSWSNTNFKKKKRIVKTVQGVVSKDKRKDKHKKNVIINERVNKKNSKYQATAVPYPFETREQYERSLRMPLGQEWVSRESHQKLTMPRVVAKHGTVIDPLKNKSK